MMFKSQQEISMLILTLVFLKENYSALSIEQGKILKAEYRIILLTFPLILILRIYGRVSSKYIISIMKL